jgi:hypothetical protein
MATGTIVVNGTNTVVADADLGRKVDSNIVADSDRCVGAEGNDVDVR